jgi:inosine-uridine nucleoside N-ribohydrolase
VAKALQPQHAVQAIIDLSHRYSGELDIVALGPLTNIALALRMDPTLPSRVRSFTFMGGSCYGKGNATLTGEFNFICDPEAAHIALTGLAGATSGEVSCLCLPWEASEAAALSWSEFDELTRGHEGHVLGDPTTQHALEAAFLKRTHAKYELQCRGTGPAAATANAAKKSSDAAVPAPSATASSSSAASASGAAAGDVSLAQAPAAADAPLKSDQLAALHEIPSIADLRAAGGVHAADPFAPVVAGAAATAAAAVDSAEYICCDSFAVACLLVPSLIVRSERHHVQVLLQGDEQTRGMLAVDWYDKKPPPSTAAAGSSSGSNNGIPFTPLTIVTQVHRERYLSLMRDVFQGAPTRGRQVQQKKQQQ